MTTPVWQPGTLYSPGAVVQRSSAPAVVAQPPANADFELGDVNWDKGTGPWTINTSGDSGTKFNGTYKARAFGTKGTFRLINDTPVAVVPGMSITASCMVRRGDDGVRGNVQLEWLTSGLVSIRIDDGTVIDFSNDKWKKSEVTAIAPATAAFVRIAAKAVLNQNDVRLYFDAFQWNYAYSPPIDSLIFTAVQAAAGYSGGTEPAWPSTLGVQVIDNEVTWEAIDSSTVTWEAAPILVSGATEPVFPTEIGDTVADNTIIWTAISRRVEDEKCPNGTVAIIAASKIFCADDDIIPYCATVNPLDWSSVDDAGYLPFGLQAYGSNPVKALGLYRGNLVAFSKSAFQMWQVDPDPQAMALLDATPIGCTYPRTLQPFQNDLVFLSAVGVRNIGIAGASTNLQTGGFGEPVDPIVKDRVKTGAYTPLSTFVPEYGQYWLIFGPEVIVMTVTGLKQMSWSRYIFPEEITDVTLLENVLYARTITGVVWRFDDEETADDVYCQPDAVVLSGTEDPTYLTMALSWTAATFDGGISEYVILRSVDGSPYSELDRVDNVTLAYTDTNLLEDTQYIYLVVAVPTADGIDSEPSNGVGVQFDSIPAPVLTVEAYGPDALLAWTESVPSSGAVTSYEIYRSTDGGAYSLLTTVDDLVLTYTDTTTAALTSYSYYVVAVVSSSRRSPNSNIGLVTFGAATPELLYTYTYNINAKTDAGVNAAAIKTAGYHLTGAEFGGLQSDDTLVMRVNTSGSFIAWSPWGRPTLSGSNTGSIWRATVVNGVDDSLSYAGSGTLANGYVAARAIALAEEPFQFTGSTEYWIGIRDTPVSDNTGGCSVTVEVWGVR